MKPSGRVVDLNFSLSEIYGMSFDRYCELVGIPKATLLAGISADIEILNTRKNDVSDELLKQAIEDLILRKMKLRESLQNWMQS